MKSKSAQVILLTGPGGSGKTTIARLLAENFGFKLIDGDQLDTEFFPNGGQWDQKNYEQLQKAHIKILQHAQAALDIGQNAVIDYIIFGDYLGFINKAKELFGDSLTIKVLFPSESETLKRDTERTVWHTGIDRIRAVRKEFEAIRDQIGTYAFIDTTGQTPLETLKIISQE